jgi:hypothetical protein
LWGNNACNIRSISGPWRFIYWPQNHIEKSIQQSVIEDQLECRKQDKSYNDNVSTQESSIENKFVCKEAEKCLSDGLTIQQSVTEDQLVRR